MLMLGCVWGHAVTTTKHMDMLEEPGMAWGLKGMRIAMA
jgi:hypothetical protein